MGIYFISFTYIYKYICPTKLTVLMDASKQLDLRDCSDSFKVVLPPAVTILGGLVTRMTGDVAGAFVSVNDEVGDMVTEGTDLGGLLWKL